MNTPNRDLLVLTGKTIMSQQQLDQEVQMLNNLLYQVENFNAFCIANEVIDINKYKIISKPHIMMQIIREKSLKPFVFINNKN